MSGAAPRVTVVVPTHDGAERVPGVLGALLEQEPAVEMEIVVVDSASGDATDERVEAHPATAALRARGVPVRVVREDRAGLTRARARGAAEARADVLCFLDDDTLPAPGYVAAGAAAFRDPTVGLLVSRVRPRWAEPPPPAVERRAHLLAVNEGLGDAPVEWEPGPTLAPTLGAGLWIRRAAFEAAAVALGSGALSDRTGGSLVSGGDIELGWAVGAAGWRRVYLPELRLEHCIPAGRLRTSYFCRLIAGIERSKMTLEARYDGRGASPRDRAAALASLVAAAAALPALLLRRDGAREAAFVLASRWARLRGPYRAAAPPRRPEGS